MIQLEKINENIKQEESRWIVPIAAQFDKIVSERVWNKVYFSTVSDAMIINHRYTSDGVFLKFFFYRQINT